MPGGGGVVQRTTLHRGDQGTTSWHRQLYYNHLLCCLVVDAASKLPPGVMDGRLIDLGGFDQCLSVEAPGGLFRGQHCIVETKGLLPDMDSFNPEVCSAGDSFNIHRLLLKDTTNCLPKLRFKAFGSLYWKRTANKRGSQFLKIDTNRNKLNINKNIIKYKNKCFVCCKQE